MEASGEAEVIGLDGESGVWRKPSLSLQSSDCLATSGPSRVQRLGEQPGTSVAQGLFPEQRSLPFCYLTPCLLDALPAGCWAVCLSVPIVCPSGLGERPSEGFPPAVCILQKPA